MFVLYVFKFTFLPLCIVNFKRNLDSTEFSNKIKVRYNATVKAYLVIAVCRNTFSVFLCYYNNHLCNKAVY